MKALITLVSITLLVLLAFWPQITHAQDFGSVMDVSGQVTIHRGGQVLAADLGMTVSVNDRITLGPGAKAVIVSFADCFEWNLTGPDKITISTDNEIVSKTCKLEPTRRLPVCYKTEKLMAGESKVAGGLILRGGDSLINKLRKEFEAGRASNSTLMTLIMHDLKNNQPEEARPYFEALKKRAPKSLFVKKVARFFGKP